MTTKRKLVPDPFAAKPGTPMVSEALADVDPSQRMARSIENHYAEHEPGFAEQLAAERGQR